jgi:hypothetical protein
VELPGTCACASVPTTANPKQPRGRIRVALVERSEEEWHQHVLSVRAKDKAGNIDPTPATVKVKRVRSRSVD